MNDGVLDILYIVILLAPVVAVLVAGAERWWATRQSQASASATEGATVTASKFVRLGQNHQLQLVNEGAASARNVRVYVNNRPVTAHGEGAPAEQHPLPELAAGRRASYPYTTGQPGRGERALVRIEWTDSTGTGTWESTVGVP